METTSAYDLYARGPKGNRFTFSWSSRDMIKDDACNIRVKKRFSSIPIITRDIVEDDYARYIGKKRNRAYNYGMKDISKENKMEKYKLTQTEKACISLMQNNGETLGTMTLAILEGNNYLTSSNSIEYYTHIQAVRKAIQDYLGGEDD